jgi:hypothetical protein
MSNFLEKIATLARKTFPAAKSAAAFLKRVAIWLSPPPRFCAALLSLAFTVSLLSWAIGDRVYQSVLFFPQARGEALRGEPRNLPRTFGTERKAELIASELLLGPAGPSLRPAFPSGVRVASTLYRHGTIYVDLSEDAALADPADLKLGLRALEKSLRAGLPWARRITLTIGGMQPYLDGLPELLDAAKKNKKN